MVLTIAAAVFVFGLLVLVHELGHFMTAKATDMRVDEFAIGFGPKLFSFRRGETEYSLRAIPLGGFNDIAGMNPEDNKAGERGYCEKPVSSRMIVILSGSVMNFILPVLLFFGIFFFAGVGTPSTEPVLGTVLPDKPAAMAGLREGDRILSINGVEIENWSQLSETVRQGEEGSPVEVVFQRGSETQRALIEPYYDEGSKRQVIGVLGTLDMRYPGVAESMQLAVQKTYSIMEMMLTELGRIFAERSGAELAGPIGVAQMAGEMAQLGFIPLLNFAAFLSLNLGIINLLPVPALDGGHFMMLLMEAVRGKPMSPKTLYYLQSVGVALLVLLMLFATKNDVVRVFTGG